LNLAAKGCLDQASILFIDKADSNANDKTFCFWSLKEEPIIHDLNPLISCSWNTILHRQHQRISMAPYSYHHVSSKDLYSAFSQQRSLFDSHTLTASIQEVGSDACGAFVLVNNVQYRSKYIFDSRTPNFDPPQDHQTHIFQSFVGWKVEFASPLEQPDAITFMDFEIDQMGHTQFVYVLPFSSHQALVEVTRFGSEVITSSEAEILLARYLSSYQSDYSVVDVEKGCIPMSNCSLDVPSIPGVTQLGYRNYMLKCSTGYAFKNMYYHARSVSDAISNGESPEQYNRNHPTAFGGRFAFYDSLLLHILDKQPEVGKHVFNALLNHVDMKDIWCFLDEKTRITQEIRLFSKLPWMPFLRSLGQKIISTKGFRPLVLFLLTIFLALMDKGSVVQEWVGYGLFAIGMVWVGIPHGAVDHLLESGQFNRKTLPSFMLKYLGMASLMAVIWWWLPFLALIVFIIYSSWHFGQADSFSFRLSPVVSFFWGASVLCFMIGTHQQETEAILAGMGCDFSVPSLPVWSFIPWLIWALFRNDRSHLMIIAVVMMTAWLPLILAFGVYFIGQHSMVGWRHLRLHLQESGTRIWWKSLPFHLGAWAIMAFFYFWNPTVIHGHLGKWGVFFMVISCISFPHVLAMHGMYGKRGSKTFTP
jgi:lycopene beta-cyclase